MTAARTAQTQISPLTWTAFLAVSVALFLAAATPMLSVAAQIVA